MLSYKNNGLWKSGDSQSYTKRGFKTYLLLQEGEGERIDTSVLSTRYRPSPIPSGGIEIPLMMTFRSPRYITHQKMKDFMTKLYCYDHKPVTESVESDLDSDEFHIEIKENVVEEGEDSKVVVASKAKQRKVTIAYNSDDSEEEKEKTQKKFLLKMTVMYPRECVKIK